VVILLTGATGTIGRRLLPALQGHRVRCLVRRKDAIRPGPGIEVVVGDAGDREVLRDALRGVEVAYYLLHSMGEAGDFAERDRALATRFGEAAREAGVRRIVYLGGLGHGRNLSEHLASRQEVGRVLAASGVPTIELRASVVIGAGSLPFDMARRLVERLPVMVTPRWVRTPSQPIAIDDVVAYLLEALDVDLPKGGVFEIGGATAVSYGGVMREIARQQGLRRWMIPVPVLTPTLSSLWLALVTPREAQVGRALIEGVRNETVVQDSAALRAFRVRPRALPEAVAQALAETVRPPPRLAGARAAIAFLGLLAVCLGVGALGALVTAPAVSAWYPTLAKPAWTPPDGAFGPVWTALYLAMAVAAWRVLVRDGWREGRLPLIAFAVQLALNAAWSWIFFGARAPCPAFVEILFLWPVVLATTMLFFARSRLAGWLMVPYLAWAAYAAALNGAICSMNP